MNPEIDKTQDREVFTGKKIPVSELLRRAGESFDIFTNDYEKTGNSNSLYGKKLVLEQIIDGCERYGSDWDEYKEKILQKVKPILKEIEDLINSSMFRLHFGRVAYSHDSQKRQVNILYELSDVCSEEKTDRYTDDLVRDNATTDINE